jgi:chromate transport protein ChrA
MLFCVVLIHAGLIPAIFVFLTWSLPGAIGMYALSQGVQRVNNVLPSLVYALLSGLNASTVGIIALAAVQLAEKAIKDPLTRLLVILGACAGLCYNALWYFPVLMLIGGAVTVIWDIWLRQRVGKFISNRKAKKDSQSAVEENSDATGQELQSQSVKESSLKGNETGTTVPNTISTELPQPSQDGVRTASKESIKHDRMTTADTVTHAIPVKLGLSIIAAFFCSYPILSLDLKCAYYLQYRSSLF